MSTRPEGTETDVSAHGVRWDLSDLYRSVDDPALAADLQRSLDAAHGFAERYRGRVGSLGPDELARATDALEGIEEPVARAESFASLVFAADTAAPAHGALLQRVQEQASAIRNELLFFQLEWVTVEEPTAARLLASPALARRRHFLAGLRRYRPHLLSEPEERILEETANTGSRAFGRLFDEVMSAMRFRVAGESLGEEEVLSRLHDPSREVRRGAAHALTEGLRANARLLGFVFNTLTNDKAIRDRLRRYETPMQERHLDNEIEPEIVTALLESCEKAFPLVTRYYRLKARLLGIERLADYDRYAPLATSEERLDFAAARELVLGAYADFSPRFAEIAASFFERRWIDAELRAGKRGGAFSASTVPSVHPYVLLNYTGTPRDVMTLAHELGHGVHQYLAREQGLFEQDTPLPVAETASVFGEMLVFRRLLRDEDDPRAKLGLLCSKLEDAFATVFRQVAMTRFEEQLHQARRRQGELPVERVNELWMEANRRMFGDSVELTDDYAWWWLYIPHFVHTPFYCYAYAFGDLLVWALVQRYDEEGERFVPAYLELLRAGGSRAPRELMARVGLDVGDPAFWKLGLGLLESLLGQAEELAGPACP